MTWIRHVLAHWRRLVLLPLMTGLGFVLYEWLPPVERWHLPVDPGAETIFAVSPDGRFCLSAASNWEKGNFRKREAATGALVAEWAKTAAEYECQSYHLVHPPWHRYWAGLPNEPRDVLELYDLETGTERRLTIEPFAATSMLERRREIVISPRDDVVVVYHIYTKYHLQGWESWSEVLKVEIYLYALPDGEKLASFVTTEADGHFSHAGFFFPGGSVFAYPTKTEEGQPIVRLWDVAKRRAAGSVPGEAGVAVHGIVAKRPSRENWWLQPSADDRYLQATDPAGKAKLWDLADLDRPVVVEGLSSGRAHQELSPDSRTLVEIVDEKVVFRALPTGKELGSSVLPDRALDVTFSPESSLVAISIGHHGNHAPRVAVLDVETREILHTPLIGHPRFSIHNHGQRLLLAREDGVELLDARTGRLLASIGNPDRRGVVPCDNGQRALVRTEYPRPGWVRKRLEEWLPIKRNEDAITIRVIDLQTGREDFRLHGPTGIGHCLLSPDGSTLVTRSLHNPHIRCYDVPARHPWMLIVGIPASAGAILFLIGWAWKRWRGRKPPATHLSPCPPDS